MFNETMLALGKKRSCIRELFEYGLRQAQVVGKENVYDYSLGNPSIPAPPEVNETFIRVIREMDSLAVHSYTPAPGAYDARKAVADELNERFGTAIRPENIFFTCGAAPALLSVIKALAVPDAEIIGLAPYFPEYRPFTEASGARFVEVPADYTAFQVNLEALEAHITPHTQAVIVNSPNNPSGVIYSVETLQKLGEILTRKGEEFGHPIYIVADEPYRDLVYDGQEVVFLPSIYKNTIYCYSFSKSVSLPGERVGFMALPPELDEYDDISSAVMAVIRAFGYICVSSMWQRVAIDCLGATSDISIYKGNRDLLYGALTEMGYTCVYPDGAFYLFMKTPEPDAEAFCRRAMKDNLLVVPGDSFGTPGYVRLAYCVSRDVIERALPVFRKLAEEYGIAT